MSSADTSDTAWIVVVATIGWPPNAFFFFKHQTVTAGRCVTLNVSLGIEQVG